MSIMESNKIDAIAVDKENNRVVLMIADHLDWEYEGIHLKMIQDKVNAYISFIESGQIYEAYPKAKGCDGFVFDFRFKNKITKSCERLLDIIKENTKELNITIKIN